MKKTETKYKMVTTFPMAGKYEVHTKKEWKRIYGYEIGLVAGVRFVKVETQQKTVSECLYSIWDGTLEENSIKEISKEELENFILEVFNKGILTDYLNLQR